MSVEFHEETRGSFTSRENLLGVVLGGAALVAIVAGLKVGASEVIDFFSDPHEPTYEAPNDSPPATPIDGNPGLTG